MVSPSSISISKLRADVDGRVIAPEDAEYEQARALFYGGMDRHPAAIVRVKDDMDIVRVVALARESGLELAVRSGGHSIPGHSVSEGGIVIDLADMRALEIDVEARTTWAQTGLTALEFTTAAAEHGLVVGFGDTGSVGIGGITLGGGVGYLVRKYGLTIDDLLAADIVTADGEIHRVDAENEPDLFWAIRGGGGNFGVATRFRFRLHEIDTVVGGMLLLPATVDTIAGFMAEAEAAPEELSSIANIMKAPPMPFVPEEAHGKLVIMALMTYAGDPDAGQGALAPFRALAEPVADLLRPMPYPEVYPPEDEEYHPVATARTMFVDTIGRAEAETILQHLATSTAMMGVAQLRMLGGAMARVPADATAFAHRQSKIMVNVAALYERPDEVAVHGPWVEAFAAALRQGDDGAYVNFLADEGEARIRAAYPGTTWDRLRQIKARYDPTNLFRLNQNIPPAAEGSS
ncbi:MAG TPA: FAD-binding oxidoreductase [Actinomycetota bacterium]|nr:FAD-binding oxidoreductase [Actinomycetota bacterium]